MARRKSLYMLPCKVLDRIKDFLVAEGPDAENTDVEAFLDYRGRPLEPVFTPKPRVPPGWDPLSRTAIFIRSSADLEDISNELDAVQGRHTVRACLALNIDSGDSGDPAQMISGRDLAARLRALRLVRLVSGWWLSVDLAQLPTTVRECHLSFSGGADSISGIGAHWRIFANTNLVELRVHNEVLTADDCQVIPTIDAEALEGQTSLRKLELDGLDMGTARPLLALPRDLRNLRVRFAGQATRSVALYFMSIGLSTDAFLRYHFGARVLASLRGLDFHHRFLESFRWGRFEQLVFLRVHADHLFPAVARPWGEVTLAQLLPATLRKLVVWGCRFGDTGDGRGRAGAGAVDSRGAVLERSLLRLADELAASHTHRALKNISISVSRASPEPMPEAVRERLGDAGVNVEVHFFED